MSIGHNTIAIYSNLPSGGALITEKLTTKYLSKYFKIIKLTEPKYRIHNFIEYLFIALVKSRHIQKTLISVKHDLLIIYHSWMVKTPSIARYTTKKVIYICHETMREYYDLEHIKLHSLKETIINFIRLPVKWLDNYNASSKNIVYISNSKYSKQIIDKAYGVNSIVIYPGIETKKYLTKYRNCAKLNQVICVGAINKYKRQDFIIDVISKINKSIRPKLVLVGNGADKMYLNNLRRKAKIYGVDLQIMISVSENEKINVLKSSKIFMYAPVSEPFGLVVEEAMAAGLALVVYKYGGGYIEILSKNNGIILDNLNPIIWANNISKLLINPAKMQAFEIYNKNYAIDELNSDKMNCKILSTIKSIL